MDVKHATCARRIMAIFCLVLSIALSVGTFSANAQGVPGVCTGEPESPCGFPVAGNPSEFTGNSKIHDSCEPEGACPWIQGVDIWWPDKATSAQRPTSLLSVLNGTVVTACHKDKYLNKVIAVKNTYYLAYYLHADDCYVSVGQQVKIGDQLGLMGDTGRSNLTHVHFALKLNSAKYSLRLNELLPLLNGWSVTSGMNPSPVTYVGEQPANVKIDDLPYAMAGEVVWVVPYTPTPVYPTATATFEPTQAPVYATPVVQPTQPAIQLPKSPVEVEVNKPFIILILLALALIFARNDEPRARRR